VQSDADVVQGGLMRYYEHEDRCEPVDEDWMEELLDRVEHRTQQARDLLCTQPTVWRRIYRRSLLEQNHIEFPEEVRMFDDLPFQFMSLACSRTMAIVNEPLYYYRLQRAGQDVGATDERLFVNFQLFEILGDLIARHNRPDLLPYLFKLQVNSHCWGLEQIAEPWKKDYFGKTCEALTDPMWRGCNHPSPQLGCFLAKNYAWYQALQQGKMPIGLRARGLARKALTATRGAA
jgi:hypothetical protein